MEDVLDAALGRPRTLLTNGGGETRSSAGVRLSMWVPRGGGGYLPTGLGSRAGAHAGKLRHVVWR